MTIAYMDITYLEGMNKPIPPHIEGMPKGTVYPLPAGTPFFIKYITGNETSRYDVYGTHEIDDRTYKNMKQSLLIYLQTKVIPKGGRSIMREAGNKHAIKYYVSHEEGDSGEVELEVIHEVCEECGGEFIRETSHMGIIGEYVCQKCGLVYEPKESELTHESFEDVDSWKQAIATAPADEVEAKVRCEAKLERHKAAKATFAQRDVHTTYEGKWTRMTREYRKFQILTWVKEEVMTTGTLLARMGVGSEVMYRLLRELEASGRITSKKVGKSRELTYVQ